MCCGVDENDPIYHAVYLYLDRASAKTLFSALCYVRLYHYDTDYAIANIISIPPSPQKRSQIKIKKTNIFIFKKKKGGGGGEGGGWRK